MSKFITKCILVLILNGCGSHLLITTQGYRGDIQLGEYSIPKDVEMETEEQLYLSKDFVESLQTWAFFGHLMRPKVNMAKALSEINAQKVPITGFTITSTYRWYDMILGLFPFAVSRTVIFSGKMSSANQSN
jgi:hypothetical protein